ncbi:MAG: hypothetical protein AAGA48_13260 [Myxococcota bacterium]
MWMWFSSLAMAASPSPYPELQIAVHGGLVQPLLVRGFNAAVDVRAGRFVASYSHGEGLDFTRTPGVLPDAQREVGVTVRQPWTTGFGIGASVVDELTVLVDFKVHRIEVDTGLDVAAYSTVTLGGEVGYRLFVVDNFFIHPVVRFWPTIATTAPNGFQLETEAGAFQHDPLPVGAGSFFANVLVGYAFDVKGTRRTFTLFGKKRARKD